MKNRLVNIGFIIYLIFTCSWFLHLGSRFQMLGSIRFDLLLVVILVALTFVTKDNSMREVEPLTYPIRKFLRALIVYSILIIPFVEWPGSVIRYGLPNFIKAVVFFFFTVNFIRTEKQLKIFVFFFLACQCFRIMEPIYLHITQGYWGSEAYMEGGRFMNRLSGAPYDIVNPNGLAFLILSVLPFLYYFSPLCILNFAVSIIAIPICLYGLVLTESRSGLLGLAVVVLSFILKSKHRGILILCVIIIGIVAIPHISGNTRDRYLSIVDYNTKNASTAEGRLEGIKNDLRVALRRPFFGYGLGTSREANYNFGAGNQPAHDLYAEILQDLGGFGLVIFLFYIKAIIRSFYKLHKMLATMSERSFLFCMNNAMTVWFAMNLLFSFASYGLLSYEWYLFPGLTVVLLKLVPVSVQESSDNLRMPDSDSVLLVGAMK